MAYPFNDNNNNTAPGFLSPQDNGPKVDYRDDRPPDKRMNLYQSPAPGAAPSAAWRRIPLKRLAAMLIVCGIAYAIVAHFIYVDPLRLCVIDITTDILAGNRGTVQDAIRLLKREDPKAYDTLCGFVGRISEQRCMGADWHLDASRRGYNAAGCFIKGSRTVYLKPERADDAATVQERKAALKTYAEKSREYWTGR